MSKIMHCIASLGVGGVETQVLDMLGHFLRGRGSHEHILCAFRGGELERQSLPSLRDAGLRAYTLNRRARYDIAFCRALRKLVDHVRPDIIQAYNPTASLWTRLQLGRRRGLRIFVHCAGVGGLRLTWRAVERSMLSRTSLFIFSSHSTRAIWENALPITCPRHVVHYGITNTGSIGHEATQHLPQSPFVLLTVCRIVPVKSISTQLRAVELLHRRGQTDVRLMILGDGPMRGALEAESRGLGIEHVVMFEGYQPQPRAYHRRAHVYLCTSYNETFSVTLAEAMLDGMICIAPSVGGPSEIIEDNKCGFLIPCSEPIPREMTGRLPRGQALPTMVYDRATDELRAPLGMNPAALADKIAEVRARYEQLDAMRQAAHDRIVGHFSMTKCCDAHEKLYDALV